jgi:hypothetical protein
MDMMSPDRRFNIEDVLAHILHPLLAMVCPTGRKSHAFRLGVHLDNYQIRFSNASKQFVDQDPFVPVLHPPYGSDLTPSDFWLFGSMKKSHTRRMFCDVDEFLEAVSELLNGIQLSELDVPFGQWIERAKGRN